MYPVWHIIVDEALGTKISGFYKTKNAMVEPMYEHIQNMKEKGQPVLQLRQDNAGENKKLVRQLKYKHWKLDVEV